MAVVIKAIGAAKYLPRAYQILAFLKVLMGKTKNIEKQNILS